MPESLPAEAKKELRLMGVAAAPGIAHGSAFVFLHQTQNIPRYSINENALANEELRLSNALIATRRQITSLRDDVAKGLGVKEAEIFDSHLTTLDDPALVGETLKMLHTERLNIEYCFNAVAQRYLSFFDKLEDSFMRERAIDVRDVTRRVLNNLLGTHGTSLSDISEQHIVVADTLTPSDTANMRKGSVRAFVTNAGNCTSHAVIMSRSLRIPAVVGLMTATSTIQPDDELLVDGFEGVVYINPSKETLWRYGEMDSRRRTFRLKMHGESGLPDVTEDGLPFALSANVNGVEEMPSVLSSRAQGVGLYRTEEFFFKDTKRLPTEAEQYERYAATVTAAAGAPVVIRTLDVGGDKPHEALFGANFKDANPFMGLRAVRVCLERLDVFRDQLRAILRSGANGPVKILVPMIASVGEILQVRAFLEETKEGLRRDGLAFAEDTPLGAMLEIPSATLCVDLLAKHCDFFSIGTNDLVQYLLAVDRGNGRIAHLYEPHNPAVLRVLRDSIQTANRYHVPISVCGELAGTHTFAPLLFALGADSLSMTPAQIPEIRYLLRRTTRAALDKLLNEVFALSVPREIKAVLQNFANERMV